MPGFAKVSNKEGLEERNRIKVFLSAGFRTIPTESQNEGEYSAMGNAPLAIREWLPEGETVEACKARLKRIVGKQQQCYSTYRPFVTHSRRQLKENSCMARP
jgi:hypothetical protein